MLYNESMKAGKDDIVIAALAALAAVLLLDHFRIHGYWFDAHDLIMQTDSGRGFDSHEFFWLVSAFTALALKIGKKARPQTVSDSRISKK